MASASDKTTRKQIQPEIGAEKAFGQALREIRKARGISQEELAFIAGLDRTYISLVERGLNSPTIRTAVRIASVLRISLTELVLRMEQLLNNPTGLG